MTQNFLGYVPLPNFAGSNGNNYTLSSSSPLLNTTYTVRIDHSFSDKLKIFGMYDSRDNERYTSGTYTLPPPVDPNGWQQSFITHYGRFGFDYIISPAILNHFTAGYNRTNSLNLSSGAIASTTGNFSWPQRLGLNGISGQQFPIINLGEGVPSLSRGNNDDNLDNGWRFNDTLSWVKGGHSFTFGVDARNQLYGAYANTFDSGTYNFARSQTAALQTLTGNSGNSVASFLLGNLDRSDATIQAHAPRWTSQYYAAFIQDDWKVTSHLTLNLGLRWDLDLPRVESYNNTSTSIRPLPIPLQTDALVRSSLPTRVRDVTAAGQILSITISARASGSPTIPTVAKRSFVEDTASSIRLCNTPISAAARCKASRRHRFSRAPTALLPPITGIAVFPPLHRRRKPIRRL